MAGDTGAAYVNIEVICSDPREHRRRVESRLGAVPGLTLPTWRELTEREYDDWTVDRVVVDTSGRSERECCDELLATMSVRNEALQPTRAAQRNGRREPPGSGRRG